MTGPNHREIRCAQQETEQVGGTHPKLLASVRANRCYIHAACKQMLEAVSCRHTGQEKGMQQVGSRQLSVPQG